MGARHLLAADLPAAATTLAQAFADDPMLTWLAGDSDSPGRRENAAQAFFAPSLAAGLRRGHAYGIEGDDGFDAVSIWSPPDVPMLGEDDLPAFAEGFTTHFGEDSLGRLVELGGVTGELHPAEPHFYLFILGAAVHGKGAGGRVIGPTLDRCDAEGLPAYLESSNPRNVAFYERLGFSSRWEQRIGDDGPLLTGMWRDPDPSPDT
jgi:GNAT superfamily N-acetyltransferase